MKLWPLFRYARDDTEGVVRWSAFGPIIEFTRTREERDLRIRPLLWLRQKRGAERDDQSDILFPLVSTRWQNDYQTFRFLLFTYSSRPPPQPDTHAPVWTTRFDLFPFVFYRSSPVVGTYFGVLPFYLDMPDFYGFEHARAVLFPAYLRLTEPRVERRFFPFPFVSTVGGPAGRGFRFWPVYGRTENVGTERTSYILWPFHIRRERLVPGYGWEQTRVDLPVMSAIDGPRRRGRYYGVFAYTHTVDQQKAYEAIGAPFPFVYRERALGESEYRTWRLAPFYGRSDRPPFSSRFYAWPAYRVHRQDQEDFHYERDDAILVLWRRQRQSNEASGHRERLSTLFPIRRSVESDGRRFGQMPAIFDSLMPKNRGVLAMWAPLYGLYRWDTEPGGAGTWNVGWGLVARERERLVAPWHLAWSRDHGG
ncbi:MAG: hypothetical protein E6J75_03565 [Deltaproteobacteria bacterium]|nr:MAG: hypothetical protein E6J75_03565 [Deltaproteobacteria bacterium]